MRNRAILAAALLTVMMTACGSSEQPEVVEQIVVRDRDEPAPTATSDPAVEDAGAVDLIAMGEDAFQMCTACHVVDAGARSTAGPNLHGVLGRVIGDLDGYSYSDALTASDAVWDEENLDQFLADPSGYLPGTDMLAGAVRDDEARAAIIAYLASKPTAFDE
ncbi:c-type cytochrome [Erythrobacter sp. Alg231-14]|uniref:c-type cytochrome n=1 Tax=Erythrobacter sp. Alg231-14 TaxID=1922225 RepID=UPI000D55EFD7